MNKSHYREELIHCLEETAEQIRNDSSKKVHFVSHLIYKVCHLYAKTSSVKESDITL